MRSVSYQILSTQWKEVGDWFFPELLIRKCTKYITPCNRVVLLFSRVLGLFNDTFESSDYITPNDRWLMKVRVHGMKRWRYAYSTWHITGSYLEGLRNPLKIFSYRSLTTSLYLKLRPPDYGAGVEPLDPDVRSEPFLRIWLWLSYNRGQFFWPVKVSVSAPTTDLQG
jgi:hypothetical protein